MMIWWRIMLQFLFVITPWELSALTKKRRSADYTGGVRNLRHISGSSPSLADWEVGLREAVLQALLRERYQDPNLRERLVSAPLIGRRDSASPFGDVAVLARGQLYGIHGGNFAFVQDPYRNDCDDCHNPRRCARHQCQPWTPHNQEQLIALWTVKRLRHHDFNNVYRYEIEYTISPITPETQEIITRRGRFNYAIPGHVFVIKSHDDSTNPPTVSYSEVYNRKIPHKHFIPDILIGVDTAGYKHVLHSYPGFYTHPVHPSNNRGTTLKATTESPSMTNQEEEPKDFPKPTKPMEVRPSDEPEPSDQMSAPGEETETTPYSNILTTTTKIIDESSNAIGVMEKTTETTFVEMTKANEPITAATKITTIGESTTHTPKVEVTQTTDAERSTTSMAEQAEETTENVANLERPNRTKTTERSPEIKTSTQIEEFLTTTQAIEDEKLTTSVQANLDKVTENMLNKEITTQQSATQTTTKRTSKTTRKHTTPKKPSTVPNDFLVDAEPVKEPIHTKPAKQEYSLDDIFGSTIPPKKPTQIATVEPIESDLAIQLFGEKMASKYKVIYSNFYEPSTAPTLLKYDETTVNLQPLTSQSYETSISFEVNKVNDTKSSPASPDVEDMLKESVSGITRNSNEEDSLNERNGNSTTESGMRKRSYSTKKAFDELAMQLVNHARGIDYASKTSRAKYKRRRTYKPKTRQLTRKRKKPESNKTPRS